MTEAAPLFSVVVPSRGEPGRLMPLLAALARQTMPRTRFEILIALDGAAPDGAIAEAAARAGARIVRRDTRRGPGVARNLAAAAARGEYLAFTEDDCTPAADWLERAAASLANRPAPDVLEGVTLKPGGRPVHRSAGDAPRWLPTNLFVRRTLFERAGGYCEDFFDPAHGIYFREDSDFGFTLEEAGATVGRAPDAIVTHPDEHPGFLDPLRWARRYEMDPLLAARHPRLFRERIEVHRVGPLVVRRPVFGACLGVVLLALGALALPVIGAPALARVPLAIAAVLLLGVWAKWGFAPWRLPLVPLVPFVMVGSFLRGLPRARRFRLSARLRPGTPAAP